MSGSQDKEPILVGVQTRTLKQIEDVDPIATQLHQYDIFGGDKTANQTSRLISIPPGVPYMFGIGGGLHVLHDVQDGQPVWQTADWQGDPPRGFVVGGIYFRGDDHNDYVKVADSTLGGWVWQRLTEEEELSFKTGRKNWEYKLYFSDLAPKPWMLISLTNQLNMRGWGRASVREGEDIEFPPNLELRQLEPDIVGQTAVNNYLVIDPNLAEVLVVRSRNLTEEKETELEQAGWTFVDSNIARALYVKTKAEDSESEQ